MMANIDRALFLDRDGVINIDKEYVFRSEEIEFIEGIFSLCQAAQKKGYKLIVVTNQSGIARQRYTEQQFLDLMNWMNDQFKIQKIDLDLTLFCPHHPDYTKGTEKNCDCRKPRPGMLLKAQKILGLNLENSIMVGDSVTDMKAAQAAGIKKRILLNSNSLQCSKKEKFAFEGDYKIVEHLDNIIPMLTDLKP